jgi:serine protease AprX
MRTNKLISLARSTCLAFVAILIALPMTTAAADSVWVRIHHAADHPALTSSPATAELADYGSFQWGQISANDARDLQNAGLRMTVLDAPFEMTMGGERFDLVEAEALRTRFSPYQADPSGDFHLVQFDGPVRSEWLRELRATGAKVVQPVQPFSYYVWATAEQISATRSLGSVRATSPLLPEWKVQPHLRDFDAEVRPTMALISGHDLRNTAEAMRLAGADIISVTRLSAHFQVVHLDVAGDLYMDLGQIPGVYTVQEITQDAGPRGEMSNQSIVGGIDNGSIVPGYLDWLNPTGYDGSGVIVGIVDGGVQENHPDLVDNIMPCTGTEGSCTGASGSHGTHVAGAVGGTGVSGVTDSLGFLRGQGVAPGAGLVNQAYGPFLGGGPGGMVPEGMLRIMKDSADSGALLTNNSWGPSGTPQGYNIPTMEIDFISRDALPDDPDQHPILAVWSIMNGNGDSGGACAPSSLGSPDEAKNLFGVGSTGLQTAGGAQVPINDVFSVSSNSAHGPACDGRRVPDIVAPGCRTDSTSTGSSYGLSCGTSMASPVVSGAIALWAERYIDETGQNPSPALMKAVFIAVAEDLVGGTNADGGTLDHRPDRFQGFGRLDLDAVMNPAGDFVYLMDQEVVFTEAGQDWGIGLNAADPTEPMKIMLTWTDAPGHGQGGTTPAWVNILDLEVDALDGNTYLGNVVGPDGWSEPGGNPDDRNNTEGVWLRADQHQGGINLRVLATEIAGDALNPYDPGDPNQDFAIACYNCIIGDPTFSLAVSPITVEACVPDSGSEDYLVDVSVNAIGQYEGTVALSASGEPAGVGSSFDPMSVEVPGSSEWTLTVDSTASAGASTITLTGDDGEDTHERELNLVMDEPLLDGPALVAPADGASDLTISPTFSWSALPDVADYRIQVATDAGFGNLVHDEVVEDETSFVVEDELDTGTEYFWRVSGLNLCGEGVWSDVFSFTTRLEPEAQFSATDFSLEVQEDDLESVTLEIANVGTGNLTWAIVTDLPDGGASRDEHEPSLDEDLALEPFTLPAQGEGVIERDATGGQDSRGMVIGFTFEGTVAGISGVGTWASDMVMTMTAPDGTSFTVGGFSTPHPDWDFQGSGSNNDGTYASTHIGTDIFGAEGVEDVGTWEFEFEHTWNDAMDWTDVTITLHKAPLPVCGDELTNVDWLSVDPDSGVVAEGEAQNVSVMVNTFGLDVGEYVGYLCVETNAPNAELVPMPVELEVTERLLDPPVIGIDPTALSVTVDEDGSDSAGFEISNSGEDNLTWFVDTAPAGCELPGWASLDPNSGSVAEGDVESVTVHFDAAGLEAGEYSATACIASNDPNSPRVDVELEMTVTATTALIEGTVTGLGYCQDDPAPLANAFVNINGQTTTTDADGSYAVAVDAESAPVIVAFTHPDHRGQSEEVAELEVGQTVTVDADLVLRAACATVDPEALSFSLTAEATAEQVLTVSNALGGSDLQWSLDTSEGCFDPAGIDWLSVSHTGGTIGWGNVREVTVSANAGGMAHGSHETTLCLVTDDDQNESIEVPVVLEVVEPLIFEDRFEASED